MKIEARLYEKLDNNLIHCYLCSHHCRIAEKKFGLCGVRQNIGAKLYTYAYGKVVACNIDPIEKKPLYHFLPGSSSFSIATIGCNFRCGFCQNWQISQQSFDKEYPNNIEGEELSPKEIVNLALRNDCKSISYTYTEPTIFFEYAFDTAKLAKEKGLYNNFVTNGYMTKDALDLIMPYLDAANVDLKFFKDSSYKKICAARLEPVLESIKYMKELDVWVEVTTLIVPGENDSAGELEGIAKFIADIDKNIPWHISRFHPNYKFNKQCPTPEETLKQAYQIGSNCGLNYIYIGNVIGFGNDTVCHNCKKILIKRELFNITQDNIKQGKCRFCGTAIPGLF